MRHFVLSFLFPVVALLLTSTALAATTFAPTGLQGGNGGTFKVKRVPVTGQEFTTSTLAVTTDTPSVPWGYQMSVRNSLGIVKGDQMLVSFWARACDAMGGDASPDATAESELVIEMNKDPWAKLFTFPISVGSKWFKYVLEFKAGEDLAANGSQIAFRAGFKAQSFQIAGFTLVNYGSAPLPADIVLSKMTYPGVEPDAEWRKAADARIDRYRKADMTVTVVDTKGKAVAGATVDIKMKRHDFGWGTAINSELLLDDPVYQQKFLNLFNIAVTENHLKWPMLEWLGFDKAIASLDFLKSKGIPVRGHNLVWPGKDNLPDVAKALLDKPEELRRLVADHVTLTATKTRGKVVDWDVINEPIYNHDIQDVLGRDIMVEWFRLARRADPNAMLALNEAGALESPLRSAKVINDNIDNIRFLRDKGAPINQIGLQAHYGWSVPSPMEVVSVLDRYAEFGFPIVISEFDVNVTDEGFKADYTRDFMTAAFSHPAVSSFLFWGFWAGAHWLPEGALYREDWSLRPLGQVYKDLVFGKWWTKANGATAADGRYSVRGFKGVYEVTVKANGRTKTVTGNLVKDGTVFKVVL